MEILKSFIGDTLGLWNSLSNTLVQIVVFQDVTTSNSGITLSIAVTGRPFPTVTWLHEGMLLDNGVLEATNQITASGKYSCVAINHNGKTSTSCDVMISYRSTSSSTGALLQNFQASLSFYEDSWNFDVDLVCYNQTPISTRRFGKNARRLPCNHRDRYVIAIRQ